MGNVFRFSSAALCLLVWASAAWGQTAPTSQPTDDSHYAEIPADIRPFALLLPKGHFFGDWGGVRTDLEQLGITPTLALETDMAANPTGGKSEGITEASNLGLDLLFDLNKLATIKDASFLLQMSERWGSSLSNDDIGNAFNTQQVFGGETIRLVDAAYQQKLFGDQVEFRIGRIAANDDFQVSPYDYFFMQNGFDGNPVGIYFNSPGMSAYPDATWGSLVKVRPTRRTYAMVGVYNGDPNIRSDDHHGTDATMRGPVFVIGEAGLQLNGQPGDSALLGNYKTGFWYDASEQTQFGSTNTQRGSFGVYGLFDQVLIPIGTRESNRGFGTFGSATFSTDPSVGQMPYFFTGGFVARGIFDARPDDVCGLGVLYGQFSQDLRRAQEQQQLLQPWTVVQDYELVFELAYKFYFLDRSFYFQPDLQYINHPDGNEHIPDALVVGCRVGINF